jgi:peptidoglycan/xylan/chitin deacetylase (PgdA/CDA1 family)
VLLYHSVGDGEWAVPRADFARQMEWLAGAVRPLSLVQALGTEVEQPLEVAVTFDDGYASVVDQALPVLRSLGLTATVFLNTAHVGDTQRRPSDPAAGHYPGEEFLLWRDVDQLLDVGWSIGSHGDQHLDLTRQPETVVRNELSTSKSKIEALSPGPCLHFAYTWGRHTRRLRELVEDAGYKWGLAGLHETVDIDSRPFEIPRMNVDRSYSLDDFKAIIHGDWDYLRFIHAWRATHST